MIFSGSWLISQFAWILYVFGAFLLYTGIKMAWPAKEEVRFKRQLLYCLADAAFSFYQRAKRRSFFVKENGLWFATPLFLCLVMVELSDVVLRWTAFLRSLP